MIFRKFLFIIISVVCFFNAKAQVLNLGNDTTICNLSGYTLTIDSGFASYIWENGDTNRIRTVFNSQTYTVNVIDSAGNAFTDDINIYFSFPPIVDFEFIDAGCPGDTVTFIDISFTFNDPMVAWRWDFGDGTVDSGQLVKHVYEVSGTYLVTLTVTNDRGCDSSITKAVSVFPIPVVNAGNDTLINAAASFVINATATQANYQWQPAFYLNEDTLLNPICTPLSDVTYTLTAIDSNGCINSDTMQVKVNFAPEAFNEQVSINPNSSTSFNPIFLANDENDDTLTYTIVIEPKNGTATVINDTIFYEPNENFAGNDTIRFRVCDTGNPPLCDEAIIIISVGNRAPEANNDNADSDVNGNVSFNVLGNDIEYNTNQQIEIDFISTPENGSVEDFNNGNLVYTPNFGFEGIDSFYYVICDNGQPILCDTGWVYINMNEVPLFINNAFTPNGDGQFDTFIIEGINNYPESELLIFNRWGEIIFKAIGYNNDWDGFTGFKEEVPEATYFYQLKLNNNTKALTGYIVLTR